MRSKSQFLLMGTDGTHAVATEDATIETSFEVVERRRAWAYATEAQKQGESLTREQRKRVAERELRVARQAKQERERREQLPRAKWAPPIKVRAGNVDACIRRTNASSRSVDFDEKN